MFTSRFSSSIGPVGIDIGARGIRMLQLREHGGIIDVVGAAFVDHVEATEGPTRRAQLADALREAFVTGGFTGRRCVVSLSRTDISTQPVRLPRMPEGDLRQALRWEAAERFGLAREGCEIDYVRTGACPTGTEAREEFLLIAASHARLNEWIDPIMDAGLRPMAVDAWFTALARACSRMHRRESDQETVRAVVEVGASGSTIMILRGDQVAFCKALSLCGQEMDRAVAAHLRMDGPTACDLRSKRLRLAAGDPQATPCDPAADRAVYEAVRPLLGDLVREMTLCVRYYGVTFRGRPPERVVLSGGDAMEPHLDEMIAHACKCQVIRDDEVGTLATIQKQAAALLGDRAGVPGVWTVAAGLSMRGLASERANRKRESQHPQAARKVVA